MSTRFKFLFVLMAALGVFLTVQINDVFAARFCVNKFANPANQLQSQRDQINQECQNSISAANRKRMSVSQSRQICSEGKQRIRQLANERKKLLRQYRECESKYRSYCGSGGQGAKTFGSGCETMFKQKYYPGYW